MIKLILACLIGVAVCLVPLAQWIDYKLTCKKFGKEIADEIFKRM